MTSLKIVHHTKWYNYDELNTRGPFHERSSLKFDGNFILLVVKWSLWKFTPDPTAVLSWHVHNCVAIWYPIMGFYYNHFAYRIWITMEITFVKWAPAFANSVLLHKCDVFNSFFCMMPGRNNWLQWVHFHNRSFLVSTWGSRLTQPQ